MNYKKLSTERLLEVYKPYQKLNKEYIEAQINESLFHFAGDPEGLIKEQKAMFDKMLDTKALIKAELDTREHVLNKTEKKTLKNYMRQKGVSEKEALRQLGFSA